MLHNGVPHDPIQGQGHSSDVTISKFQFSIDFDSIFSRKSRFRFDSILVTSTRNHSRQNSVTTDAGRSSSNRLIAFTKPAGVC